MKKQDDNCFIRIGVDYYPEHWDRSLWEKDADLMKGAGVNIVRMAEFAWSRLEPREGEYTFDWLDEAVEIFADRGIEVFLCTPTATPPLWLFEKYPETIQVDKSGHKIAIGIRGHRCLNSPVYRELSKKLIERMVSRYRDNEYVIGYQIDNELEANHCCCSVCEEKFRSWIKDKYGTVENVNSAYGNSVWSGEYSDFSQIHPPYGKFQTWLNPSYTLDFNRYASDSTVDYVNFQAEIIRKNDPKAVVTTNNWLCENMPDFYDMFDKLDFVSYDNYPTTIIPQDNQELYSHAFHLDMMRGIRKEPFWIMEQLSGSVGSWMPMAPTPRPGMIKGYSLQAIAHGADAVLHFRFRTAASGAEMFWHGLIDHSNVPGRRFDEFKSLCQEVKKISADVAGSVVRNKVAILYSSDNEYAFKLQPQVEGMYYFEQLKSWHDAFLCIGINADIINQTESLDGYGIVVAPTMFVTNRETVNNLHSAALNGATVIFTNRSGVKDEFNKCIMESLPTVYSDMTGAVVKEYDAIGAKSISLKSCVPQWDIRPLGTQWCDLLEPVTAEIVAKYDEDFYKGDAAITRNNFGKGVVYYVGTVLDRESYISLATMIAEDKEYDVIYNLPRGVEISYRYKNVQTPGNDGVDKCYRFIFNNTNQVQKFEIHGKKFELQPFEMSID